MRNEPLSLAPGALLKAEEACALLCVVPATLRRWRADGKIRAVYLAPYKRGGGARAVRYFREDLERVVLEGMANAHQC